MKYRRIRAYLLALAILLGLCTGCKPTDDALTSPDIILTPGIEDTLPTDPPAAPSATPVSAQLYTPPPVPTPITFPADGYIAKEGVNLRENPSTDSAIIDIMGENAVVRVVSLQDGWYRIDLDGKTVYAAEDLITLGTPPRPDNMHFAKVIVKEAQLYKTPLDTDPSEVVLVEGEYVKVLRKINDYLHIVYGGNLQRYMHAAQVEYVSEAEAKGEAEPGPEATPAP